MDSLSEWRLWKMKQLLTILVAIFGLSSCCTTQAVPQQPEPTLVQIPLAKSNIAEDTTLRPEGCVTAEVNYDLTLAEIARGYDWVTQHIKKGGFRAKPRGKGGVAREVCWFTFDRSVTTGEAQHRIEASGDFLVADLWELNSLGTAKPDLQLEFPFVALGSEWRNQDGYVGVPGLSGSVGVRELYLDLFGPRFMWDDFYRFLAVSK